MNRCANVTEVTAGASPLGAGLQVGLLGPMEVRVDGGPLTLGPRQERALLALLALQASRVVPRAELIDGLWGETPPETAAAVVQVYVSRLRKLLPPGALLTRAPGYVLAMPPGDVDVQRFESELAEAARAEPEERAARLRAALELWRGAPLAEFADEPFARVEIPRLQDLRVRALEERFAADLTLGRSDEVVGELRALIAEHPHRERLRRLLMLALYRAGRHPEALAAYHEARAALAELGLEPTLELRKLERAVLIQDPALDLAPTVRPELPGPLRPQPAFPFVGREQERSRLRALLDRAEDGEGACVVLAAEAGGGKTRLARELAGEAAARGALVLYGTSDAAVRIPYGPVRQWLEYLVRTCDPSELHACLQDGAILAQLVPEIGAVAGATAPQAGDAEADGYLLLRAAAAALSRLAERRTVLAIADDVHWADDQTLHLLRTLARTAPETRLLLVATYRDVSTDARPAVVDALADLWRLDGVARLTLGGLEREEIAALVRESVSADAEPELVAALTDLTDGNPLLVCELWRGLLATNAVEVSGTSVRLVQPIDDVHGPERIRDAVRQRLDRLGSDVAAIVELAAVAGPTFDLRVLTQAADREDGVVRAALDRARAGGLIEELPGPHLACRFSHELVRRAVFDPLGPLRRAELHLRVGEALEHVYADELERVVHELATHFARAVPATGTERAVTYAIRAAEADVNADAYAEAADRLEAALELGIRDEGVRRHVQMELALVQRGLGHFDKSEPLLASITDEPFAAALARFIRLMNDPLVDPEELLEGAQSAIETFAQAGDTYRLAVAWRHLGMLRRRQGRFAESLAALETGLREAVASGRHDAYRWLVGSLAYVLCDGPMPVSDAIRRVDELERSSPPAAMSTATLAQFKGVLLAMAGRLDEARELLEQSATAYARHPTGGTNRLAYQEPLAEAWELLGEPARAERELVEKHEHYRRTEFGIDAQALQAANRLALLCCDEGRWDEAERWIGYGSDLPVPERYHDWAVLGLAARSRIAAQRADLTAAAELGRRAVELAELSDRLNLRARAWLALAEVHCRRDEVPEADAALAAALRLYEAKGNVRGAELAVVRGGEA